MNAQQKEKGFTIIEVVLVLAIAGLIFLMVFIALPALQRNQRDTQRRQDVGRVQTAVANFSSANRGAIPSDWVEFTDDFLLTGSDSFIDPAGSTESTRDDAYSFVDEEEEVPTFSVEETQNVIYYTTGAECDPENSSLVQGAGSRKVAFRIALEGGGAFCVNN